MLLRHRVLLGSVVGILLSRHVHYHRLLLSIAVDWRDAEQSHEAPRASRRGVGARTTTLCSRREILKGSWEQISLERTPYVPTVLEMHGVCYKSEKRGDLSLASVPFPSYDWEVSSSACVLAKWSATSFCDVVQNRTIAFVGDSLSQTQYYSLGYLLGHQPRKPMPRREWKWQSHQPICDNRAAIYWRGDHYITALPDVLGEKSPEIVVINRGAHHQPDDELVLGLNDTVRALREWQGGLCREVGRRCRLFFRSTTPGHPRCSRYLQPLRQQEAAAMAAVIGNRSSYRGDTYDTYHWQDFQHQNRLQEQVLAGGGLEFSVLDVYDIMLLRPDMHLDGEPGGNDTDCLHYCLPGPYDFLNRLLLHELLRE